MFEIEKTFSFEAGHALEHHDGKCRERHGHSYQLRVAVRKKALEPSGPKQGMVMDFHDISAQVKPMIEKYFDHAWLNETLQTSTPTAEFIAQWIFGYLKSRIPGLFRVTVCETATSSASCIETQ